METIYKLEFSLHGALHTDYYVGQENVDKVYNELIDDPEISWAQIFECVVVRNGLIVSLTEPIQTYTRLPRRTRRRDVRR